MAGTLRLGIVGLGRLWDARHKPALERMRDTFQVVYLYDQVARRAAIEARPLGCRSTDSLVRLIDPQRIDALYVLAPQWFGWHAVDLAIERGLPVYCALPPAAHPADLERSAERLSRTGGIFMPELPRRVYPATIRLIELLRDRLGPPRLIVGQSRLFGYDRYSEPGPTTQLAQTSFAIDPGGNLIDWCSLVMGAEPHDLHQVSTTVLPGAEAFWGPDFVSMALQYPGDRAAQFWIGRYHQSVWGEASRFLPGHGFQVYAERGAAWVEMPDRLWWTDASGTHEERLALEPSVGERLNRQFRMRLLGQEDAGPTIDDALRIARWVGRLAHSAPPRLGA